MIEVNLLPPRFKRKRRAPALDILQLPKEDTVLIVGALAVLLIMVHIFLAGLLVVQKIRLSGLNKRYEKISAPKKEVDDLKRQITQIESKTDFFTAVTTKSRRILLAQKLNQISDFLPPGVWLTKLTYVDDRIMVGGSAISKKGEEMVTIGKFASALKNDPSFTKEFANIELSYINRRLIKSVELADFTISCSLKE
jgi:Tfp pilus assembly protein PilN